MISWGSFCTVDLQNMNSNIDVYNLYKMVSELKINAARIEYFKANHWQVNNDKHDSVILGLNLDVWF